MVGGVNSSPGLFKEVYMVTVEDTQTGKTFEVEEAHWEQNLWRVKRYKKSEPKKPVGRPKKTYTESNEED